MPSQRPTGAFACAIRDNGRLAPLRWSRRVVAPDGRYEDIEGNLQADVWQRSDALLLRLGVRLSSPNLTISAACALFVAERQRQGVWTDATTLRMRQDLAWLCEPPTTRVRDWSKADTLAWLRRIARMRFGSQKTRWGSAVGFWDWCVAREIVPATPLRLIDRFDKPWLTLKAKREISRGKAQLRNIDEAWAYLVAALAWKHPRDRVGAALPLLCGLRSGEVRNLQVADVELVLDKIWIRDNAEDEGWSVKTATSRRLVALPPELRADLQQLCSGPMVGPESFVLRSPRNKGGAFNVEWLRRLVNRTCRRAGVRIICAHGLRGTYASILALSGEAAPDIGRHLGHADGGGTARRHYIGAETPSPALRVLPGGGARAGSGADSTLRIEGTSWRSGRDLKPRK